jgi:hypothetical protein
MTRFSGRRIDLPLRYTFDPHVGADFAENLSASEGLDHIDDDLDH